MPCLARLLRRLFSSHSKPPVTYDGADLQPFSHRSPKASLRQVRAAPTNVKASCGDEPVDAVAAGIADEGALLLQIVQMREGLTERKAHLVAVELAAE